MSQCRANRQGQTCAGGSGLCVGVGEGQDRQYLCLQSCGSGVDCRDGYLCTADVGGDIQGGQGVCWPTCQNYECAQGQTCNPQTGVCTDDTSGGVRIERRDVTTFQVGPNRLGSGQFDIPNDTIGFGVVATRSQASGRPIVAGLSGPGGAKLFDIRSPRASATKLYKVGEAGFHGFLYPNSPRLTLNGGTYEVEYGMKPTGSLDLDVIVKRGSITAQENRLPVTFWFVPGAPLDASSAQNDPTFRQVVTTARETYRELGIELAPIRLRDYQKQGARDYAVLDGAPQQAEAFRRLDDEPVAGMQVLVVDQISHDEGGTVLGQSSLIGGPPVTEKSTKSGVSIAAHYFGSRNNMGLTLAHEIGHYLGLFHTTEQGGASFDPLPDTPKCRKSNDQDGDGTLSVSECRGNGGSNVMFWTGDGRQLTEDQKYVLQVNPAMK